MRQDYTLYKRGKVWYGAIPDPKNPDKRIRFSTGKTTKAEAMKYCQSKVEDFSKRGDTFLVVSDGWWTNESQYVKESERNGDAIGEKYINSARRTVEMYMLPVFGSYKIGEITPGMIEDWKYSLVEEHGLSNKTANSYLSILNTMFDWWWRRGEIKENPCDKVKRMKNNSGSRGILDPEEARRVLEDFRLWNNPIAYLANLLAACTGMRMGEIQALRAIDFTEDSIIVRHNWVQRYKKLKCTKTGCIREIPIHPELRKVLLRNKLPYEYIFTYNSEYPMYQSCILRGLQKALERIGISREEQIDRKLCFHSWRHYLNSRMRLAGFPDVVTREITGHSTAEMTELYSHVSADDARGVLALQSAVIPQPKNEVFSES